MTMLDKLDGYFAARAKQREERVTEMVSSLNGRQLRMVKEAAVMGYVLGNRAGLHEPSKNPFPHDGEILRMVLLHCDSTRDLYPTLGRLGTMKRS